RLVALKVLPPQMRENPAFLERFRREAQAAARLHHTNIVPVFGVGQHEGVPYYAMQFIRGQTLDGVLQELRRFRRGDAPAAVSEAAPGSVADRAADTQPSARGQGEYFRNVATIGVQAAEALAYAHGQGVVHRDIKPANLMLDTGGTVW